ncbi:sugar porter family MFS transporter [Cryomyces antarcticus]|uniref:Major facilitator superfamily (MFS) profile domain-containing protein n=1 Tax=Cryomyces antarcticus TaxID=329879 RepID=A0ABR0LQC7_9PEZI|nr:hypothetical protein LTR39_000753 [Cryomyces antarcticus]KAK5020361.1 hypothetical protein LTR60_000584 [Cryomyces antarcticus]KAK5201829.1 hypothetical protein LTR16_001311 [Cryomyces antarcticus]
MAPYLGLRGSKLTFAIGLVAGITFLLFGYDQGDIGGLLTVSSFQRQFPQLDTLNNPGDSHIATIQGIVVATWNIGCFVSAIVTIWLGDVLGRRKTIFMGLAIMLIGEVIQASSYSLGQFIAGRFIAGFGNGFNTATVPAWVAECCKAHRKGTILMISAGASIAAGLALSYWMDFAFGFLDPSSAAWRVPIAIQLVLSLLALALVMVLPESPRWLILTGREDGALNVLGALSDLPSDDPEIYNEFMQIKDAVLELARGSFTDLFTMNEYRYLHRMILAYVVQIFQQISGINLVTQYLALIFLQQTNYSDWLARLLTACAGTEFFLASFIAVVGTDRFWGRRSLMLFGATGMSLSAVMLTVMLYLNTTAAHIVATVFFFVFITFFAIGWQGMAWLYQVEIVPLRIRGPANALSTSANWLFNFVVVLIAPVAFNNIGYRTYIILAATNAFIVPVVYFFYPETAYRSLEEVDVLFAAAADTKSPWLEVVRIARDEPLWYGRDGEAYFDYEKSDWHQRLMRRSGEGSSSEEERGVGNRAAWSPDSDRLESPVGQAITADAPRDPKSSYKTEPNRYPPRT